eukprot:354917-Chlamydomonas_euryale.AAC.8
MRLPILLLGQRSTCGCPHLVCELAMFCTASSGQRVVGGRQQAQPPLQAVDALRKCRCPRSCGGGV